MNVIIFGFLIVLAIVIFLVIVFGIIIGIYFEDIYLEKKDEDGLVRYFDKIQPVVFRSKYIVDKVHSIADNYTVFDIYKSVSGVLAICQDYQGLR